MRNALRTVVNTLDGKPRAAKGQSLIEMAFTFPFLILMILALAEIGFLANSYLTMMDLVREAGRRGSNLSPVFWNDADTRNWHRLDCDTSPEVYNLGTNDFQNRKLPRGPRGVPPLADGKQYTNGAEGQFGFFDGVVCQIILTAKPLIFEPDEPSWGDGALGPGTVPPANPDPRLFAKNEIVVSAISYAMLDYSNPGSFPRDSATGVDERGGTVNRPPVPAPPKAPVWITVTGRYPRANRYCGNDVRDPFDYKRANFYSKWNNVSPPDIDELGYPGGSALLGPSQRQSVRGFIFTGQYSNPVGDTNGSQDDCLGSTFTVQKIEERLNSDFAAKELLQFAPNGGMVIVEMHFQHHPVFFGPIFQGFTGNVENNPMLYVFSIFPAVGAEPTSTPER